MEIPNLKVPAQAPVPTPGAGVSTGVPGAPMSPPSPEGVMSQDQMRTNLQGLMSKIEGRFQDFNSQKFSSDNKLKEMGGDSLRMVFDLFQSVGVDPSNVEEVRVFLDKIKETNPEVSQKLEELLGSIIGDETNPPTPADAELQVAPEEPIANNMNMNPNETPQENI